MSTKVTLDHGDGHHLYHEIFESGKLYLTLIGAEFEARPGAVTVVIPLEIWKRLRSVPINAHSYWGDEDAPDGETGPVDTA